MLEELTREKIQKIFDDIYHARKENEKRVKEIKKKIISEQWKHLDIPEVII